MTARKKGGGKPPPRANTERNTLAFSPPPGVFLRWDADGFLADFPRDHPANNPENWENIGAYIALAPFENFEAFAPTQADTIAAFTAVRRHKRRDWPIPPPEGLLEIRKYIGAYRTPWIKQARAIRFSQIEGDSVSFDTDNFFLKNKRERKAVDIIMGRLEEFKNLTQQPDAFIDRLLQDLDTLKNYKPVNDYFYRYYHPTYLAEQFASAIRWAWQVAGIKRENITFKNADNPGTKVLTWALKQCLDEADDLDETTVAKAVSRRESAIERGRTPNLKKSRFSRPSK